MPPRREPRSVSERRSRSALSPPAPTTRWAGAGSPLCKALPSLLVNIAAPVLIYQTLRTHTPATELQTLLAAAAPAALWSLVEVAYRRTVDVLAALTLAGLATSLVFALLGGSARLFLLRESTLTAASGIVCLASLPFPRPALFYLLRVAPTYGGKIKQRWETRPRFRTFVRVATAAWGVVTLAEFGARVALIYRLSIVQFLVVDRFLLFGGYTLFIALYGKLSGAFAGEDDRQLDQDGTQGRPGHRTHPHRLHLQRPRAGGPPHDAPRRLPPHTFRARRPVRGRGLLHRCVQNWAM